MLQQIQTNDDDGGVGKGGLDCGVVSGCVPKMSYINLNISICQSFFLLTFKMLLPTVETFHRMVLFTWF